MAWVRLDDAFYDHPKFQQAGPVAGFLYVCSLAWSNRNLTDGFIPRSKAKTLVDFEGVAWRMWDSGAGFGGGEDVEPLDVASVLVEAGLWDEVEGGFRIHDFHDFQPTAEEVKQRRQQKAEAGKKGAEARWGGRNGGSDGEPMAEAMAPAIAEPMADPWRTDAPNPNPVPNPSSSSSSASTSPPAGSDDDRLASLLDLLGQHHLQARNEARPDEHVGDVDRWLAADRRRTMNLDGIRIRTLLSDHPTWTADQCFFHLTEKKPKQSEPSPLDATAQAATKLREAAARAQAGDICDECERPPGTNGMVETDGGFVPCPKCRGAEYRALGKAS